MPRSSARNDVAGSLIMTAAKRPRGTDKASGHVSSSVSPIDWYQVAPTDCRQRAGSPRRCAVRVSSSGRPTCASDRLGRGGSADDSHAASPLRSQVRTGRNRAHRDAGTGVERSDGADIGHTASDDGAEAVFGSGKHASHQEIADFGRREIDNTGQ